MADYKTLRTTMVDTQVRPHDVTRFPIIEAMLSVPREVFVPDAMRDLAYVGGTVPLGGGRHLLDPRTIGMMLEVLDINRSHLVLEIGPGLGYTTALLARLAEAVVAVEGDEARAAEAEALLLGQGVDNAALLPGDMTAGNPRNAPYDRIAIFGGVETVPAEIEAQLKDGGLIAAVFMDGDLGEVRVGHKSGGRVAWRMEFNASAPVLPGFERTASFVF
ncbi:MAG: protein-L-isoaspartate O-methyltransferase [Rhodobacteraceae bacterium]|jgi:protein-L-isoaspartate(D-aspartate) O-methyltransferase|nr:protein-L-isoaspartate O-methyltransferase [Paracoccaceae bacterium]